MEIIRALPADAAPLTRIAHAAKRHWGYPERWITAWSETLTIHDEFITNNIAYCAVENARPIGFYVLTRESDGLHLDHLWIAPDGMGRGIGRALFEHALEQSRELGHATLHIESDPHAEGFYTHMGAQRVGARTTQIDEQSRELPLLRYDLEHARI